MSRGPGVSPLLWSAGSLAPFPKTGRGLVFSSPVLPEAPWRVAASPHSTTGTAVGAGVAASGVATGRFWVAESLARGPVYPTCGDGEAELTDTASDDLSGVLRSLERDGVTEVLRRAV